MNECQGPDCPEIKDKIIDLIRHQLAEDEQEIIEEHIQSCPMCEEEFRFLNECMKAFEPEDCLEMTEAYWEEFTVSIHDKIAHVKPRSRFPYAVVLPIAATVLAALGISYFVFIRPKPHQVAKPKVEPNDPYQEVYELTPDEQQEFIKLINQRYGSQ
jgi:hypothetical protein